MKHGGSYTRLYNIWSKMKSRCLNLNSKDYPNYGGRGITICPEWLEFIPFRDWALSNGYAEGLQIDRIKNKEGYYPNNCRWVTQKENIRNRDYCKITMKIANEIRELNKTNNYTRQELAEKYDVNVTTITRIINNKTWDSIKEGI